MSETQNTEVKETKKSGWLSALIGFGAGAVVGSVTALLFAPQSGEETREKIKDRMTDVSDKATEIADRAKESLEEAKDRMASAYEEAVEKTTNLVGSAKEKLSAKKDDDED